ncbi:F0F1 ATP synthase subunit alpha [Methylocystis sp. MJC1]|jgi:F-type H+-transporting ATPase subunit alpha|uniref:F0F1 ATP synthase subunit alpha n=1 Tax=Methylocystis sp. MJC1 TaxID=2654282 RepID=UPI0013EA7C48|nr:F0F1 ATP synthase subunit alpha [Methylocystis sp. MJC1]KAF2989891.1 ATP synthase subunit alpha [Methylocystis sp. MJC1]MBU6528340.1 F0F1 ATP synthase subunit alpha [Methylocystis sp. MJC1]UZX11245.1 F0F1 ATP synthase subunit alpha [Methylocystis sp. MJC1]
MQNEPAPIIDPWVAWLEERRNRLAGIALEPSIAQIGRVESFADGVAFVSGLPQARLNELLRFENGSLGFATTLDVDRVGVVLLDEAESVEAGTKVAGLGETASAPVGPGLLGRVIDPLGRPLDNAGPILAESYHPVERNAPAIYDRDLVTEPVETGLLVIDSMFPIGRGQRELILGDRATGKTAIAIDAILNQKHSDVICIYVAIGQRATAVERAIDSVRARGAIERTIFVVAAASSAPGLQWIAPFAGITMAEYFRDRGSHALVIIDDLTKHAATHRELALLTREPPGREAYPGDIFYLHARLLERAAKLSKAKGGGSLTALPIAETEAGNLSAYIPTNLISITDGQIVLDSRLFAANQRPAVDVGLSVSRVGGKAQPPALKQASARLRLQYSQFLELELFSRFGGVSTGLVRNEIIRGQKIRALLTQPRFELLRQADQVALLVALEAGVLDPLTPAAIWQFREHLPERLDRDAPETVAACRSGAALADETRAALLLVARALAAETGAASTEAPA